MSDSPPACGRAELVLGPFAESPRRLVVTLYGGRPSILPPRGLWRKPVGTSMLMERRDLHSVRSTEPASPWAWTLEMVTLEDQKHLQRGRRMDQKQLDPFEPSVANGDTAPSRGSSLPGASGLGGSDNDACLLEW